jgi:hypothetical protein
LIVGRNKDENEMIKSLALPNDLIFYAKDYVGPNALLRGDTTEEHRKLCAAITLRYSDAPKKIQGVVNVEKNDSVHKSEIVIDAAEEADYVKYRI